MGLHKEKCVKQALLRKGGGEEKAKTQIPLKGEDSEVENFHLSLRSGLSTLTIPLPHNSPAAFSLLAPHLLRHVLLALWSSSLGVHPTFLLSHAICLLSTLALIWTTLMLFGECSLRLLPWKLVTSVTSLWSMGDGASDHWRALPSQHLRSSYFINGPALLKCKCTCGLAGR